MTLGNLYTDRIAVALTSFHSNEYFSDSNEYFWDSNEYFSDSNEYLRIVTIP